METNNSAPTAIKGYSMDLNNPQEVAAPSTPMGEATAIEATSAESLGHSDEVLRTSMRNVVHDHCCWGKKPVELMSIASKNSMNSYHVILETFLERRTTKWSARPHRGEIPDGPLNGIAPQPWEIQVPYPSHFHEEVTTIVVPHTENVQQCSTCFGSGNCQCNSCAGRGRKQCTWCNGRGYRTRYDGERQVTERCVHCDNGMQRCNTCNGLGTVTCSVCDGCGRLVRYVEMTVKFHNEKRHEVVDVSGLDVEMIKGAQGIMYVQQEGYRLLPPTQLDPSLVKACGVVFAQGDELINKNTERLHQQRISIRCIPVTKAVAEFKGACFDFWVFGTDNVCHVPAYPQKCCCGCSVV